MNTSHSSGPKNRDHRTPGSTAPTTELTTEKPERPSLVQMMVGALTAVSATALLSFLGVWGTIFGMGLLSILTVLGNYMYSSFIHRTTEKVKHARPENPRFHHTDSATTSAGHYAPDAVEEMPTTASGGEGEGSERPAGRWRAAWRSMVERYGRRRIVASIAAVFVALAGTITAIELTVGKPMSDIVRNESGGGTSIFGTSAPGDSDTADSDETQDSDGWTEPDQPPDEEPQDDSLLPDEPQDEQPPEEPQQEQEQQEDAPQEEQPHPQQEEPQQGDPQNEPPPPDDGDGG